MKRKDLIDQLVSEIETGKVRTLGIYGHGASGKSTFAQELYQCFRFYYSKFARNRSLYHLRRHLVVPKQAPDQKVTACLPVAHELGKFTERYSRPAGRYGCLDNRRTLEG